MAVRDLISRSVAHPTPRASHPPHHRTPWWVRWLTNGGRPIVALTVLLMCAPGEHHLGVLAGWDSRLAWGMAAVLAAYAGIAAAVASNRPAGAPGKVSAVIGAFLSLAAAMAAQVVSHLFVTGHLTADPRAPMWLVVSVSIVPPLVFGHLLHLAATPVARPAETPAEQPAPPLPAPPLPKRQPGVTLTQLADETAPEQGETGEQHDEPDASRRLLTTGEVADRYGVRPSTVGTWVSRGKLAPALKDPSLGNLYDPETLPEIT